MKIITGNKKIMIKKSEFNYYVLFLILLFSPTFTGAQMFLSNELYNDYNNYKVDELKSKRISYDNLQELLTSLDLSEEFRVKKIGSSLEGRDINLYSFGSGETHVLAWSQMHGDESTATMAILDMLNFLNSNDKYKQFRETLSSKLTIHFIPMLNPDGAEKFKRRNALDIDLNRDALRLQFPESQALKYAQDSIKPKFGFNLHDQDQRYSAGKSHKSATLSLLAPAFNVEKDINEIRGNAMKVIVNMTDELSKFIPGHIGRYDDEFEPRAFGDNFVKWGTGTILIESGGWKNNFEKQFLRKLNFVGIFVGLQSMAQQKYIAANIDKYWEIPENRRYLFDVLFRNLTIEFNNNNYVIDIGVNHIEKATSTYRDEYYEGVISDIGDLSTFFGYEELDCSGMIIRPGKIKDVVIENINDLNESDLNKLYQDGITSVKVKNISKDSDWTNYAINLIEENSDYLSSIEINGPADFVIVQNNSTRYVVINGYYIDLKSGKSTFINGTIFR
jgi:hypothetical protein